MSAQDCEQLTLYPEASHASRFPSPGSAEARKTTVTSGLKCLELSKNCGPLGLLEKMLLGSSIWRSTLRLLTWKLKATPSGRLYFQLAASKPRTSDIESPLWPTPTATMADHGGPNQRDSSGRPSLCMAAMMWQTPNVPNGGRVNPPEMSPAGKMPDGRKRQVGLEHQVKMVEGGLWPTVRAKESGNYQYSRGNHNNPTPTLSGAVSMWPTPINTDWKNRGCQDYRKNREFQLQTAVIGQLNPDWVETLMGFPVGWTDLDGLPPSEAANMTGSLREP